MVGGSKCARQTTDPTRIGSGRKMIEILKKNLKKDPSSYEEDDIGHMRKVVSYYRRHLAQEDEQNRTPIARATNP